VSSLDADVIAVAKAQGRGQARRVPRPRPLLPSDQSREGRRRVPEVRHRRHRQAGGYGRSRSSPTKTTYHQPSDEYRDTYDFAGAVEDSRLAFLLGCRVAAADEMPRWTKGDEFEAVRLKALAEIK
jgi:hypothetical protein